MTGYQFIGCHSGSPDPSSTYFATLLAIDPGAGWALLAGGEWIAIGTALPTQEPFDPIDVLMCGQLWLLIEDGQATPRGHGSPVTRS